MTAASRAALPSHSTEHFERGSPRDIAAGWRVTRPSRRPTLRAFRASVPADSAWRVACDGATNPTRLSAQPALLPHERHARRRGACAAAHARRCGSRRRFVVADVEPVSPDAVADRPGRRRCVESASRSSSERTSCGIRCIGDVNEWVRSCAPRGTGATALPLRARQGRYGEARFVSAEVGH